VQHAFTCAWIAERDVMLVARRNDRTLNAAMALVELQRNT